MCACQPIPDANGRFATLKPTGGVDQAGAMRPYLARHSPRDAPMFSKTADPTGAPPRPAMGNVSSNNRSILSSDLKITGEITSTGTIEVLGEVDGTISAIGLIIGGEGRVTGQVNAETVEVKGRLDGRVDSQSFTLRAAAAVTADVSYSTLVIESGAQIEGRFTKVQS